MNITFKNNKLRALCNDEKKLYAEFGKKVADKIKIRLAFLESAANLNDVPGSPPYNRHKLQGKRSGQFAIDIDGRKDANRIVFEPVFTNGEAEADLKKIVAINIIEVGDYHS
jgi:toxin HigB-1